MQSPNAEDRVKDNAVILMSLLVTRFFLAKTEAFPLPIKKAISTRIARLIREYRNPSKGIRYEDPEDDCF